MVHSPTPSKNEGRILKNQIYGLMIENIEVGSSISSYCHTHPDKGYKISLLGQTFRVNRRTIRIIGLRGLRRDGRALDTILDNKAGIKCKFVVLGLWDQTGEEIAWKIPGLSLLKLTVSFVNTLMELPSNLNFYFSLGLIIAKLSAEYGKRFMHFLTKTGPYISKKL